LAYHLCLCHGRPVIALVNERRPLPTMSFRAHPCLTLHIRNPILCLYPVFVFVNLTADVVGVMLCYGTLLSHKIQPMGIPDLTEKGHVALDEMSMKFVNLPVHRPLQAS